MGAGDQGGGDQCVVGADTRADWAGCEVSGQMGDGQIAAGGQLPGQGGDDAARVVGVGDEVPSQ